MRLVRFIQAMCSRIGLVVAEAQGRLWIYLIIFLIDPKAVWAAAFSNALIKGDYRTSWKKR